MGSFWANPEVWSILTTVVLQDGPFWAMRMYIIIGRNVVHPTILFFTIKNGLVLMLETYRLAIIATTKDDDNGDDEELQEEDFLEDDDLPIQKPRKKSKKEVNADKEEEVSPPKKKKNKKKKTPLEDNDPPTEKPKKKSKKSEVNTVDEQVSTPKKKKIFDYDARNYVCASWYPRGTRCVWDVTFDLGAKTMSYSASLISGKDGSTTSGGVSGGSKISLKTSETDAETYRGAKLNFYHAFNCDSDSCEYVKAAGGTVYDLLDFNKAEGGSKLGSFTVDISVITVDPLASITTVSTILYSI
ncbi:Oidioi.mRNA.OKI2018_I69.XSR.g14800.t1.cds [Oikopleura dioica]|uniref:Oidioi.mRNA.OKI2018_I69.XSR.g14800.t1.cds n=1 Tax=Oikopleura dioica TaxID=34765 RepID=A0ABN7SEW3_OIKDI|nr:Oidioi.mRNA.OKI2018_I69.XSR.g14800.t1.cds [Oikopleura dioica]